jgi:tRNA(Ile)-lysidine synthase
LRPAGAARELTRVERDDLFSSVIPVLVTGIQPRRVCAVNEEHLLKKSLAPMDMGALDSCDKHRNDGGLRRAASILNAFGGAMLTTFHAGILNGIEGAF